MPVAHLEPNETCSLVSAAVTFVTTGLLATCKLCYTAEDSGRHITHALQQGSDSDLAVYSRLPCMATLNLSTPCTMLLTVPAAQTPAQLILPKDW